MSVSKNRYVQIPIGRCAGNKLILNEVAKILEKEGYDTHIDGTVFNIVKPKQSVTVPDKKTEKKETDKLWGE